MSRKLFLIFFVFFLFDSGHGLNFSTEVSERQFFSSHMELSEFEKLQLRLKDIQEDLRNIKLALFISQNKDMLDLRILKCAAELSRSNEVGALKYWQDLQIYLASFDQAKAIATKIIKRVDLQSRENLLPLLNFVQQMNVPQAYEALTNKLKDNGYFYENHEPILLAENIKLACGTEQRVYTSLPSALQHITGSIVTLKNRWNNGYLYYQSDPDNFFTWFSPHKYQNHYDGLPQYKKPRGHWEFNLVEDDKIQIVNAFNGNVLMDPQTVFFVELASDNEIRLKVHESGNSKIVGKYLIGKGRNRGEQFVQIEFVNKTTVNTSQDQLRWIPQSVEQRAMPDMVQKC